MFWYLVICGMMMYPCMLLYVGKTKKVNTQLLTLQVSCILLWFFMAMRGQNVGVDTKFYSYVFQQLSHTPFLKVAKVVTYATAEKRWTFNFEIGYRYYNRLVGYWSDWPQMITITNSCLIFFLLYRVIRKSSKNYFLSIWLYLTLGIFQTEMNVARNAIAIFLCYDALNEMEKGNWQKYMLLICFAALIHKSVLVFIPLYFLIKRPFCSNKCMSGMVLLALGCGIILSRFGTVIQSIATMGRGKYLTAENGKMESLMVGVFYLVVVLFIFFMMKKTERKDVFQKCPTGSWMFTMTLCCFGLNVGFKMASRVAALFGAYMIIFIPDMLDKVEENNRRQWISLCVGLGCGLQYILRMAINNIGGTLPYSFFWQ